MNPLNLNTARKSLAEQAYESIRDSIISLELEPGQMVSEFELANRLGVSRTPVREAFRTLMLEELIEILPQRGVRIALISERKVEEARFVRECLEVNAFQMVARLWDSKKEKFKRVEERIRFLFHEQEAALRQENPLQFLQLDEDFHRKVLELTGNHTLLTVITNMRGHLNRVRYLSLEEFGTMANLVNEHEAILDAIVTNDDEKVGKLLEHHLRKLTIELPRIVAVHRNYFIP